MLAKAIQRNVHVSSKKANLCCRLIRNKSVEQALKILENQPHKTAKYLSKLLIAACANAVHNHAMSGRDLYVFSSIANQGRTLKRTMPRARGRADLMRKRFSHLEVWVSDDPQEKEKRNAIFLKPRAHQSKYRKSLDKNTSIEIMPKLIAKKQRESEGN
ncbi:50S ribosomal protein L22 [Candidatus Mycoplasma haematohominis]|uniref:Large ribosomal subunit protein uL22 n=1 Tax=Candidatus Mycoplasma haematohominis TaxID=1494318 RepID=A0A478FRC5_9MOLU|nr:50S ribosomal protein L22 [Candidatus Mycoplasma haemohominis]GCE63972.1 50S ribosomal protein L22 [Candidatus Mycoplasma haemohominis]